MRHQRLEVQNAVGQETHGLRPRVVIAVDEFEIDLKTHVSLPSLMCHLTELDSPPP